MPDQASKLHQLCDEQANSGSACLPFLYIPVTPDRDTYQLQPPSLVTNSTPISSTDSRGYKCFGEGNHKDRFDRHAALHLYHSRFLGFAIVALVPSLLPVHS